MDKVAIVILNWNGIDYLRQYLADVVRFSSGQGISVFVADNGSTDNSVDWIRNEHPEVKLIILDRNYGFAEGYNKAFEVADAKYFVLLNSDVSVSHDWLTPLITEMDSDPLIAACMPKILSARDELFFEYAGACGGYIDRMGYTFCRGRIFDAIEPDYGQYNNSADVFWATGACMIIRAELFRLAGGLESSFFAHFEEIDLCWRLKNRGYRIRFTGNSYVRHVGGGTLPESNPFKTYLNYRNNLQMMARNLHSSKVVSILIMRMLLDVFSIFRFLLKIKIRDAGAIVRAHFALWSRIGAIKKFRKKERRYIVEYDHPEIYPGSVVFDYFIRKKLSFSSLKWKFKGS